MACDMRSRGATGRSVLLGLVGVLVLSACGTFEVSTATVMVRADRMVYAEAAGARQLVGGETILSIINDDSIERQVVLVELEEGADRVPDQVIEAELPRDDQRIIGMTHVMAPRESNFATGGLGYTYDGTSFHVHLRPSNTYYLFDRLGGLDDGVLLRIDPGEQGSA